MMKSGAPIGEHRPPRSTCDQMRSRQGERDRQAGQQRVGGRPCRSPSARRPSMRALTVSAVKAWSDGHRQYLWRTRRTKRSGVLRVSVMMNSMLPTKKRLGKARSEPAA